MHGHKNIKLHPYLFNAMLRLKTCFSWVPSDRVPKVGNAKVTDRKFVGDIYILCSSVLELLIK